MAKNRNQHTPCFGVQLNTDSRNKGLRFGCGALGGGKTRTTAYVQRVRSSCGSAVVQWRAAGSRRSDVRPFDGQQKVRRAMFIQRAGINISSIHNEWDLVYESDEQAESSERCAAKLMVSRNYAKRSARRKSATEQCASRKSALELWNTTIRIIEGIL